MMFFARKMLRTCKGCWLALLAPLLLWACQSSPPRLEQLPASRTGIAFNNQIFEDDSFNVLSHLYIYNGAGLGVADFDRDGKEDVFFAGNMVSSELYLNRGGMQFEAVTERAGVQTDRWCTGVTVTDINQDAWPDLYVCTIHPHQDSSSANYLFVNQGTNAEGIPTFEEQARAYGLADEGYSTQAAFFDYDLDGDLDMYLLTNSAGYADRNSPLNVDRSGKHPSTDRLYRNEGDGNFQNVGIEAGILAEGWGLGVAITDINQDGYPDVYVANDFLSNDNLYINQGDGSFQDNISDYFAHNSYNSMGIDVADLNNDALNDVMVLDMLPDDNLRQKAMFSQPNHYKHYLSLDRGYQAQFVRNVLQLNYGNQRFGEIGQLAGVFQTDWSWSPVMVDIDNDGWRDVLITNGYFRDVTDMDYVDYSDQATKFGTPEEAQRRLYEAVEQLEPVIKHNFLYRNTGSLRFEDVSEEWGFDEPSVSHGVAYADFDQDGDLDWVINNMNMPAFVYENHTLEAGTPVSRHYLQVRLQGNTGNLEGLGSKLYLYYRDSTGKALQQYHEHQLVRGYKSSVSSTIHFGLGSATQVDSLHLHWPDGQVQRLEQLEADQLLVLKQADARREAPRASEGTPTLLQPWQDERLASYVHQENPYNDFDIEFLLPHKLSQCGPGLAVGDLDGNGREDLWIGGARNQAATLFLQTLDGTFQATAAYPDDAPYEDAGGLWLDADMDGDQDLYVASGGNEAIAGKPIYQDRFYRNEGGQLLRDEAALPQINGSGGCVTASDLDQDGDLDLFVGGRLKPRAYPYPGKSYLLRNEGGRFEDVTDEWAPGLRELGCITQAVWTDLNQDGWKDLMVVGEWMAPTLFLNRQGKLEQQAVPAFAEATGWWNSLVSADFDGDGDYDLVAGNLGLNARYRATPEQPLKVFAKDFDENGSIDPVMGFYLNGRLVPAHYRNTLGQQIKAMKRRFPSYAEYGQADMDDVLKPVEREGALVLETTCLESSYFENAGDGTFVRRPLPDLAQVAPVFGMIPLDVNQDSHLDLVIVGNSYATETHVGRYDALQGLVLLGDGAGNFDPVPARESGWVATGDVQSLVRLQLGAQRQLLVAASNQGGLSTASLPGSSVPWEATDVRAEIELADGRVLLRERHHGAGYWSQAGRSLLLPPQVVRVSFFDAKGHGREVLRGALP